MKSTKKPIVFAWALVNDETGRLILEDLGTPGIVNTCRIEAPAIFMTKVAAKHNKRDDERLVRVAIQEIP